MRLLSYDSPYSIGLFFFLLFNPALLAGQQASCSDGIQNRDEVDVDCGGVFCADCDRQTIGLQRISTTNLCLSLSHEDVGVQGPSLAISDDGKRFVLGFENGKDGKFYVYTGLTDGSENQLVYQSSEPWPEVLSPIVNISSNGEKVLWSDKNYDGIYVANYDGSGRFKIAEEHSSEIGNMRTFINIPVIFNNAGDKVIFRNNAGGQINLIYRNGIFEVGLDQVVADPVVINKDLQERYQDTIDYYSSYEINDFVRDEQDRIVFSSNIIGSRFYGDLFKFEDSDFKWLGIKNVPNDFNQFDISADGNFLAWQEKHPDSTSAARVYKRNLATDGEKYYYFEDWDRPIIFLNHNGELLEMHNASGNNQTHVMINNEDQVFPSMQIYLSHGLRRLFDSVIGLAMSNYGERIIFAQDTDDNRNTFEVWSVDWTPELEGNTDFSQLSEMTFDPGFAVYDDERQYAEFKATYDPAYPVAEWIEYMSHYRNALIEEGDIWFNLLQSTKAGSGYDRLTNDGMNRGDEAVDNVFTENRMYPEYDAVYNGSDTASGSIRINLYTNNEFNITSYDFGPFFAYRQGNLVSANNTPGQKTGISASLQGDHIFINNDPLNTKPNLFRIYSIEGRLIQQSNWDPVSNSAIDISTLQNGQYVFVLFNDKGRLLTSLQFARF